MLTADLLRRYDRPGPRYTSYPTAVEFHEGVGPEDHAARLVAASRAGDAPLSMYVHLPFCEQRCLYCGCNVVITRHRHVARKYLDAVRREVDLVAGYLGGRRTLSQLHLGGGTPTYYSPAELEQLTGAILERFQVRPGAELAVEIDPRVTTVEHLEALARLGFNRLSLGVQDFDPVVQRAVHREQSVESTREMVDVARARGYASVNIDLIYGLPYQSLEGFTRTLDHVVAMRPDRLAVYSFAFVPWMRAHMKHLPPASLPGPALKLDLLAAAIDAFGGAGYRQIGMDHFALPGDELGRALEDGTLHRNFMGYTVQAASDVVALGVSGISDVAGAFAQNARKLSDYHARLAEGRLPVERGFALDDDDEVRRDVIGRLMCRLRVDVPAVEARFGIDFDRYFAGELAVLAGDQSPSTDGLVHVRTDAVEVTPRGRWFVRNVCMVFDKYLKARMASATPVFSRTV
jgi:oxygen-independent coproporphyrinogen-3 oxidase